MAMTWTPQKIWTTFAVIAVTGGMVWWQLIHVPAMARQQVWEGSLVSKEESRKWWRGFRRTGESKSLYYTYYWHIEAPTGETFRVEVPRSLFNRGEPGDPIRKFEGDRWPTIATDRERQRQDTVDQFFDTVGEGIRESF
jgi:hypothetical protein